MVGGAVRDLLCRCATTAVDLDYVVTGVAQTQLQEVLAAHGRVDCVGASFAVFKWTPPEGKGVMSRPIDVALPRAEHSTGPGHRDFQVHADAGLSIEDDLARRDFTINAMAVELPSARWIDPQGGRADLEARRLRAVGNPTERFQEDPLRILRGAGAAARFQLSVDDATRRGMAACADLLRNVSRERLAEELLKLLARADAPSSGLRLLLETGAMQYLVPEFLASISFDQRSRHHHLTVDEHVLLTVDEAARRTDDIVVRLAAFLHDIAKPYCYSESVGADGQIHGHFYGHAKVGARMATAIMQRLRISAAPTLPRNGVEEVRALIHNHLVYLRADSSPRALRRLVARLGGNRQRLERLLLLHRADRAAHAGGAEDPEIAELALKLLKAQTDLPGSARDLQISGSEIMRRYNVQGREIGELKTYLLAQVVDGAVANERAALLAAADKHLQRGASPPPSQAATRDPTKSQ
jgi:putative nucleotidyltransferase with HDIG domain